MKLSIIIPVYNMDETLGRCVGSVVSQSYRDWEMILVDDGSTDQSGNICDRMAKKNGHIHTVHLEKNMGLSSARNAGLKRAHGDYVTFLDSDDFIGSKTLAEVMEVLTVHTDYDILEYPVYVNYGGKRQHILRLQPHEYTNMTEYWLKAKAYNHTYAWNKIYRRKLFGTMGFPKGRTFEDIWLLPQLLMRCHRVATTSVGLYYYNANPKGITYNATAADLLSLLGAHLAVIRRLHPTPSETGFPQYLKADFAAYYASVLNILLDYSDASGKIPTLDFPILPYRDTFKLKLLHIIGLKNLCKLHRLFRHSH